MACRNCEGEIPVRVKGRGRKRSDFCGDRCETEWVHRAYKEGRGSLIRRAAVRRKPRVSRIERMEAEAKAAGCPDTYPAGSVRIGREVTVMELGMASEWA